MGIRFACHHCGKRLNIKRELAGKRGVCPACATRFRIPFSDAETSSPVEQKTEQKPLQRVQNRNQAFSEPVAASRPRASQHRVEGRATANTPSTNTPSTNMIAQSTVNAAAALSEHEPEATWYVRPPSGGQYGPASTELLRQWIEEGRVASLSLLWREGWAQWRTASEALPELAGQLPGGDLLAPAGKPASEGAVAGHSLADSPVAGEPAVTGQADLGAQRRVRSSRRVFWIGVLSVLAILLLGVLVVIVGR